MPLHSPQTYYTHPEDILRFSDSSIVQNNFERIINFQNYFENLNIGYLMVAGGGGGGGESGGGGGAGGFLTNTFSSSGVVSYNIIVGAGGVGSCGFASNAGSGTNSIFNCICAIGGGAGGTCGYCPNNGFGKNGGSGGGGASGGFTGGLGILGQGNNGGTGINANGVGFNSGAGGGGAGAIGVCGTRSGAGAGGNGLTSNITGCSIYYAGGGAGGPDLYHCGGCTVGALGGLGGGGRSYGDKVSGQSGGTNLGGGGGAGAGSTCGYSGAPGGNGGSGIVIFNYISPIPLARGGCTITSYCRNGYIHQIHTFNSSGIFNIPNPVGNYLSGEILFTSDSLFTDTPIVSRNNIDNFITSDSVSAHVIIIDEYVVIPNSAQYSNIISDICLGPDNNIWFVNPPNNSISKFDVINKTTTHYIIPTSGVNPAYITAGSDGNVWFASYGESELGSVTMEGIITEYPIPNSYLITANNGLILGPDGNIWFSNANYGNGITNGSIGNITPQGVITQYQIPNDGVDYTSATTICLGPSGDIWFGTFNTINRNGIGKLDINGNFTIYPYISDDTYLYSMCLGPDNNIWALGAAYDGGIYTFSTSVSAGTIINQYSIPNNNLNIICKGTYNELWFTDVGNNAIGRINTSGEIFEYPIPTSNSNPSGICVGPDNNSIWFSENPNFTYGQLGTIQNLSRFTHIVNITNNFEFSFSVFDIPRPYYIPLMTRIAFVYNGVYCEGEITEVTKDKYNNILYYVDVFACNNYALIPQDTFPIYVTQVVSILPPVPHW